MDVADRILFAEAEGNRVTIEFGSKAKALPAGRRFGYAVAVAVNVALLFVVNNLLEWDLVPVLTDDFDRVVPIISVALIATAIVNGLYLFHDRATFKSLTQIGLLGISMVATVRILQVFPFDFSAYAFNWGAIARAVLIISMVGIVISVMVELAKLARPQGGG